MTLHGLRIALVGPLPPPEGGIANQTRQLAELLGKEGAHVTLVQVNTPYRPRWVGRLRGVRALFRLVPYLLRLWRTAGEVHVFHVMANSGWSWHLFAAPAVWVARLRDVPCVVNYRGGEADAFLQRSGARFVRTLRKATVLAVPSGYLQEIFARHKLPSAIVPNIIDVERFRPSGRQGARPPHLLVARSLEAIYDNATALRAFALILKQHLDARMTVAGAGPEEGMLKALAAELGVVDAVRFAGRLPRESMAELYHSASVVLNPSRVDNMPNSVLEAMASGVPVVSTNVGGVPSIVRDGVTGLLVSPDNAEAMAAAVSSLLKDPPFADRLRNAALAEVQQYTWPRIRARWAEVYATVLPGPIAREASAR